MPATRAAPYRDWPTLQHAAAHCRALRDPVAKAGDTHAAFALFSRGALPLADASNWPSIPDAADVGRPGCPRLVAPRQLASRGLGSPEGRAAFLHAIAHIEFNAINLAWDAVLRFPGMPAAYYADWAACADDEARHFELLRTPGVRPPAATSMRTTGCGNGQKTAGDCLERIIQCRACSSARSGRDAGDDRQLTQLGDGATVAILSDPARGVAHRRRRALVPPPLRAARPQRRSRPSSNSCVATPATCCAAPQRSARRAAASRMPSWTPLPVWMRRVPP